MTLPWRIHASGSPFRPFVCLKCRRKVSMRAISTQTTTELDADEISAEALLAASYPKTRLKPDPVPSSLLAPEWEEQIRERVRRKTLMEMFSSLGSSQNRENTWQAHHSLNRPISPAQVTISALMASGAHLGHTRARTRPAFLPYIYGRRAGLSIIDLDQTLPLFRRAANFVRAVAQRDGSILFVGTHVDAIRRAARKAAERVGRNGFHVSDKWLPGTLTNSVQLLGDDITEIHALPDVAIFLNPLKNMHALRECNVALVPTVGIIDSDADPRIVTYPIPANDESMRTVELIAGVLSVAARDGAAPRQKELEAERLKEIESERRRLKEIEAERRRGKRRDEDEDEVE